MINTELETKYPTIEYQASEYNLEDIKRMQKTPIPPNAGTGSQWENIGAKVDLRYAPEEVATQQDLGPVEQIQRIKALDLPFDHAVGSVVGSLDNKSDSEIQKALARIRSLKTHIIAGAAASSKAPVRQRS